MKYFAAACLMAVTSPAVAAETCRSALREAYVSLEVVPLHIATASADAQMQGKTLTPAQSEMIEEISEKSQEWQQSLIDLAKEICQG